MRISGAPALMAGLQAIATTWSGTCRLISCDSAAQIWQPRHVVKSAQRAAVAVLPAPMRPGSHSATWQLLSQSDLSHLHGTSMGLCGLSGHKARQQITKSCRHAGNPAGQPTLSGKSTPHPQRRLGGQMSRPCHHSCPSSQIGRWWRRRGSSSPQRLKRPRGRSWAQFLPSGRWLLPQPRPRTWPLLQPPPPSSRGAGRLPRLLRSRMLLQAGEQAGGCDWVGR
jgi:hypothetical protein